MGELAKNLDGDRSKKERKKEGKSGLSVVTSLGGQETGGGGKVDPAP